MELHNFLLAAVYLLVATSLCVVFFKRIGLGSLLGLLIAGIIVGPHTPGPVATYEVEAVRQFTELGVVFLMFIIGLELEPKKLWTMRREVFGIGTLQIVLTGLLLSVLAFINHTWRVSLLLGFTFALSSTAFVMQMLEERGEIKSDHGRTAFGILVLQDMAVVPLLALLPLLSDTDILSKTVPFWLEALILIGLVFAIYVSGRYMVPLALKYALRHKHTEGFSLIAMLAVISAAWIMDVADLSMALGTLLMGIFLAGSTYHYQLAALMQPYKTLMISLFFISVGMSIDVSLISARAGTLLLEIAGAVTIKILVLFFICMLFRLSRSTAVRVAFFMGQCGEFGFVVMGAAKSLDLIDDPEFMLSIAFIAVSMLVTPLLARLGDKMAERVSHLNKNQIGEAASPADQSAHVVVFGYGRAGRIACTMLSEARVPYVAFDTDQVRLALGNKEKRPVYFGNANNLELLTVAGVSRASLVVVAVNDLDSTIRLLSHLKNFFPSVPVVVHVRDLEALGRLRQTGVSRLIPGALEGRLHFGTEVLRMLGFGESDVNRLVEELRHKDYYRLRTVSVATNSTVPL